MLVYVLTNNNKTLGVFSTLLEAKKCYFMLFNKTNVELEEFTLNETFGKDMTHSLKENKNEVEENKNVKENKNEIEENHFNSYNIFDKTPYWDNIYECYNCGGEDCRDGCVNDNFSDF